MLVEDLVHGKHVNPLCLKYRLHNLVALDISLIVYVLEVVGLNVLSDISFNMGT
jgi:hypothetical protein